MITNFREGLAAAKSAMACQAHDEAFKILREIISPEDDFVNQALVAKLCSAINTKVLGLKPIKIALLASTSVEHFVDILQFWFAREGFSAAIWIAPYDTTVSTVLDENSELYLFCPDIVWIFTTHRDVHVDVAAGDVESVKEVIDSALAANKTIWETIQRRLSCVVLHNNADIPASDLFSNFAGQVAWSRRNALRRYNLELGTTATAGVVIFDLDHIASSYGRTRWVDWRYWYHSKHAFTFNAFGTLAFQAVRLVSGLKGQAKKCLILDLDNTLWGGVIGDDGLTGIKLGSGPDGEAFVDFQRYVFALKQRGVILAVCSKNEEENAKEPFLKHADMKLGLEDIAVFRANWKNKADNIRDIATILNIGLDSMVFVDDNPAERDLVRKFLPLVAVPDLPLDPSGYVQAVEKHCYFETVGFSNEDRERASHYRTNVMRADLMTQFTDIGEYLNSLQMVSKKGNLDSFQLPRMAQLINKSNQFHLTGKRYSEAELISFVNRPNCVVRFYTLSDKFGDNGLISVVILNGESKNQLTIDTWVMSCRVLGRTMEEFIYKDILDTARVMGATTIIGRYLPSEKNKLVSSLYARLGLTLVSDEMGATTWHEEISSSTKPLKTWVSQSS